ncbi:MAG: 5-formyltetrahydrofolate cyclo-ligase [Candidatus Erwinia impunctatus]|nr:5-formyltetrahydrofolate cyclo-ligase [Culicoides impunctatus]
METYPSDRQSLRQQVRQRRRSLTQQQQHHAAQQAAQRAMQFPPLQTASSVALFLSFDGEINSHPLIEQLWQNHKQVYLPVIHPFSAGQLQFLRYEKNTPLVKNPLGIAEPQLDIRHLIPLSELDVVMVPLVAFDSTGKRLGIGGGFYDRTLQNWRNYRLLPVGFAHDCQQVNTLPDEAWDIPLPVLITPSRLWQWPQHLYETIQP